jgi:hypothetical protein
MSRREFEENYIDVLHNIEAAIVSTYRGNQQEMTDWDASRALEALVAHYQAERKGHEARDVFLKPIPQEVFDKVFTVCEFTLGRLSLQVETKKKKWGIIPVTSREKIKPEPKTIDELIACLRHIQKSVQFWTKEAGRQGYLNYIDQFIE